MHLDFYVVGEAEAWLALPANASLPPAVAEALGWPRFGWTAEPGCVAPAALHGLRADLDIDGFALLAAGDVTPPAIEACSRAA
ncbi:hypothetical protein GCM10028862_19770 [Luteimonas pelagia]